MLAQLESGKGVRQARVDWTGRRFLLLLDRSTQPSIAITDAASILGPTVTRLAPRDEQEQIATFVAGAPWLRSGETARLSEHEARVLATRYASEAARLVGLDDERAARVTSLMAVELETLFQEFARTGLPDRAGMQEQWNALVDRTVRRADEFVTDDEATRLATAMKDCWMR